MILRPATPADLSAIAAIHLANWRAGHAGLMPDGFLGAPLAAEMARKWAALPAAPDRVVILEIGGAVAGFALLRPADPRGPLVDSLHVAACHRGAGLGRVLLAEAARQMRAEGHGALWLEVLEGNAAARRFYARLGGVEGPAFDEILVGQPVRSCPVHWTGAAALSALAGAGAAEKTGAGG